MSNDLICVIHGKHQLSYLMGGLKAKLLSRRVPHPVLLPHCRTNPRQEVPVKHVVVNKVVEEEVQEGYVQRLSTGQAAGVAQLEEVC